MYVCILCMYVCMLITARDIIHEFSCIYIKKNPQKQQHIISLVEGPQPCFIFIGFNMKSSCPAGPDFSAQFLQNAYCGSFLHFFFITNIQKM